MLEGMKLKSLCLCVLMGYGLIGGLSAQEKGPWRAASTTAASITGDIAFSETRVAIDFSSFPIARIRDLEPGEVSAVFDVDSNAGGRGSLYRLSIPGDKKFLHKNSLCGSEDTQWAGGLRGRACIARCFPLWAEDAGVHAGSICQQH